MQKDGKGCKLLKRETDRNRTHQKNVLHKGKLHPAQAKKDQKSIQSSSLFHILNQSYLKRGTSILDTVRSVKSRMSSQLICSSWSCKMYEGSTSAMLRSNCLLSSRLSPKQRFQSGRFVYDPISTHLSRIRLACMSALCVSVPCCICFRKVSSRYNSCFWIFISWLK